MRIAVTGMGIVTPIGIGVADFTEALRKVTQSIDTLKNVPVPRGKASIGLIKDPSFNGPDRARRMAREALRQALGEAQPKWNTGKTALILSTLTADSHALEDLYADFISHNLPSVGVLEALPLYSNGALLHALGNEFGIFGPRLVISNACASGNLGMGIALDMMRLGQCRAAVLVGVELVKLSVLWGAERAAFVGHMLCPFHSKRDGSILGEGAGALVLECSEDVQKERVLGWIEGFGCGVDMGAAAITLIEDGSGLRRGMKDAIEDSGRDPTEIEYVNAHAPGTPVIDRVECRAIADLFGPHTRDIAVNATKGLTTHMSAASGIVEAAATLIQMNGGFVHGNAGLDEPDPVLACPVMGQQTVSRSVCKSLSNACGGGGLNTSVLMTRPDVAEAIRKGNKTGKGPLAITGIGSVSALGAGNMEVFRRSDLASSPGGRLEWFNIEAWFPPETNYRYMSRAGQLAASAGLLAVRDAKIETSYPRDQMAVLSGTLFGGSPEAAALLCGALHENPNSLLPSMALDHGIHLGASLIRRHFNYNGITYTLTGSFISGLTALMMAGNLLACGRAEAAIVVGHDSLDAPLQRVAGWFPDSELARQLGEGAGAVVLESLESAHARGASPWCTLEEQFVFAASLETADLRQQVTEQLLEAFKNPDWKHVFVAGTVPRELTAVANSVLQRLGLSASVHYIQTRTGCCLAADPMIALCAAAATGKHALVLAAENNGTIAAISIAPGSRGSEYLEERSSILQHTPDANESFAPPPWAYMYHALERAPADPVVLARKSALQRSLVSGAISKGPFPWKMKSGFVLSISPLEGTVPFQTVGWSCFRDREWEPDVEWCLRSLLRPQSICFDVGANLGYFTAVMAQCVPEGHVYAFEPMASTFARLKFCIHANAFANVRAFPFAIGSTDGQGRLFVHESATGNASLHQDPVARLSRPQEVEVRSLDGLLAQGLIRLPDVIKIDVEGHELEILRGAQQLIVQSGAAIVFEFNERMSRLAKWAVIDLRRLLLSLGDYEFYLLSGRVLAPVAIEEIAVIRNTHVDMLAWNRGRGELPSFATASTELHALQ